MNARRNARRHAAASASVPARNDRGNPPRIQSRGIRAAPTSATCKPVSSTYSMRPASDSALCRNRPGAGAAEHKEPRRVAVPIGQYPQHRKQIGPVLHLVDDDDAGEVLERGQPLIQPGQTDRIFEVEVVGRVDGNQLAGQRGLAALARPDDGDDGGTAERLLDHGLRRAGNQRTRHGFHDNRCL